MKPSLEQQKEIIKKWQDSPLTRHYSFSDKQLWAKQIEVLLAYRKHKRIAVKSGNTTGKSFLAADIVMDFLSTNYPSKVVTTAPSWDQVEGILWKEIANYYNLTKIPLGAELLKTELKFNEEWFAVGISTNEPVRFQGRHSPHLLVLIDEASGIDPQIWEMVDALHPEKIVALGNPLENSGKFYDCFSSPLWYQITISCRECVKWQKEHGKIPGLVTQDWITEQEEIHGKNSPWVKIHVDGEFPDETADTLISRKWVDEARKRVIDEDNEEDGPRIQAWDIASKHGENETVKCDRYGHTIKAIKAFYRIPLTQTRDIISVDYVKDKVQSLVIDADGIGEGLDNMLVEKRIPFFAFHGGYASKAMEAAKFRNLRSQFWWVVAKKFEKGLYSLKALPDREFEILKNQLCCVKVKAPDGMARFQVETKEDMISRGIKSPDYADAFVYAEYGFYMHKYQDVRSYQYR